MANTEAIKQPSPLRNFLQFLDIGFISKNLSLLLILAILGGVAILLIPIPGPILDLFMIINIIFSLLIIISVVNTTNNLELSTFPILLLLSTALRLIVNVSSTRLILSQGINFNGQVVRAFADFVTGGSYVIGAVIFIIIIVVQFMVITRGANRASEVSARFRLDSLPGKQIAIDADLSAGIIDEKIAMKRRESIQKEADFYGAMDGATKFINGEVIASIIIVFINIIGGIIIGMLIHNESFTLASQSYISFAIGDGLTAAIPSVVIAIASGIVVTRITSESQVSKEIYDQVLNNYMVFYIIGGFVILIAFIPGFPKLVFFPLGGLFIYMAYRIKVRETEAITEKEEEEKIPKNQEEEFTPEKIAEGMQVENLEIEVGYELIPLADRSQGGDLLDRIKKSRKQLALELGLVIPQIRISDNMELNSNEYQIKINGVTYDKVEMVIGKLMALDTGETQEVNDRPSAKDPVFGLKAYWINAEERRDFEKKGYTIVDAPTIITTHLVKIIKKNACEVLGRKETQIILDSVKKTNPILINEINQNNIRTGEVQKVLCELLKEQITIRNIQSILEAICDAKSQAADYNETVEMVRRKLSRQITEQHADSSKNLSVLLLGEELNLLILENLIEVKNKKVINMNVEQLNIFLSKIKEAVHLATEKGYSPILLVDGFIRYSLRKILTSSFDELPILSKEEIAEGFNINVVSKI